MRWLKWMLGGLLLLVLIAMMTAYLLLRASLPQYQGEVLVRVADEVLISRDHTGFVQIQAQTRQDAAYALGFVHAQERFFQMDLLRRNAAGELSALFGPLALSADLELRQHRFRNRAGDILMQLPLPELQLLTAYSQGVNDGLQQLTVRPFEYFLLQAKPEPWREEDSLLTIFSMYLELQRGHGFDELAMDALAKAIPEDWLAFLQQHHEQYQAAIDGSTKPAVPMPLSPYPEMLRQQATACRDCSIKDSVDIGSNNFAVAGALTEHGSAILADDMHLGIQVPATWYKADLHWSSDHGSERVTGLTLPGAPSMVVGSNGHIAWGFTNSTADWHDVIALQLSEDGDQYFTPDGWQDFIWYDEVIEVKGQAATQLRLKETQWGPLLPAAPGQPRYALRWVAYDSEAVNMQLMQLETARTVQEALSIAPMAGIPAQNLLVADSMGQIGWGLMGPIPKRQVTDWDTPQDWSSGDNSWLGYLAADEHPKLINPELHRLWSANARVVGGSSYQLLGNGGYDMGARGWQIQQRLMAKTQFTEQDLHAIQLDHQAKMLRPWRQLLLEQLSPEFIQQHQLQSYQQEVAASSDYAATDAIGYTLVRAFRLKTLQLMFAPLSAYLESEGFYSYQLKYPLAAPGWQMLQQRRNDTLPAAFGSWDDLLQAAVLQSYAELTVEQQTLNELSWGQQNRARFRHPLANAVPLLGRYLNMPADQLAGDSHMPRVQRPGFGQSQRMVVAPGFEQLGILTIPTGQSGHPLSPFYRADHHYWLHEQELAFLPGPEKYSLLLRPAH
ncbi:penicillin acylase family protein [Alkalimonas amylolytica]|uniref:Penicillin amidase n=1 Tax=Alkalimonas amylolytica TaxID=152573 RepID=A0A1H3X3G5_ALKAM|nr:penicillin acylase family protein [Alkalimonas amylolytica]SDZ93174.1 penicillin amidase [Alkalimonas amylolytica]